jgi:hypothetical protein
MSKMSLPIGSKFSRAPQRVSRATQSPENASKSRASRRRRFAALSRFALLLAGAAALYLALRHLR